MSTPVVLTLILAVVSLLSWILLLVTEIKKDSVENWKLIPLVLNSFWKARISKATDENANATTFVLSVKNSYLSKSSKVFYKYVDENGLPFDYTDIYGKISFVGENGSKVSLFGFNFNDAVSNYKSLSDFSWNSFGGGANFVVIPGKAPVLLEGSVAYLTV